MKNFILLPTDTYQDAFLPRSTNSDFGEARSLLQKNNAADIFTTQFYLPLKILLILLQ